MEDNNKPVVLFIDEAQDLHGNTLSALKLSGDGQIKQTNINHYPGDSQTEEYHSAQSKMEEIGSRAYVIDLDEQIIGKKTSTYNGQLPNVLPRIKMGMWITQEALTHLTEHLITCYRLFPF